MTHQADEHVKNEQETELRQPILVHVPANGMWRHLGSPPIFNSAAYQRILRKQQEQQHGAFDLNLGEEL